jgi:hypothetical protein
MNFLELPKLMGDELNKLNAMFLKILTMLVASTHNELFA